MDKRVVLETFVKSGFPLTPDDFRHRCLLEKARSSIYAYLLRLSHQKLLEQVRVRKRIAYRITQRGIERLEYFRRKEK
jgi:DNA-binding PadR family transcriptional regulator